MNLRKKLFFILIPVPFIIILFFYYLHLKYTTNIPQLDDYDAVIYFLSSFINADSVSSKIQWIFSQHREHRYAFPRIFILSLYYITGKINFLHILFAGHIALTGIYLVILKSVKFSGVLKENLNKLLLLFFITALFFQIQYSEGSAWAISAFFTYFGMFFSFISLYLIHSKTKYNIAFAIMFAVLAAANAGSGMLTFIAGAIIIFLNNKFSRSFIIWCIAAVIVFILYFYNYITPADQTPVSQAIFGKPVKLITFYFSYIGSAFKQIPVYGNKISFFAGVVLFTLFIFLFRKKYYEKNPPIFGFMLLLFLTITANSLARVDVGFISRYTIFSVLLIILISISYIELYEVKIKTSHLVMAVLLAVYFNLYALQSNLGELEKTKNVLIHGAILSKTGDNFLLSYPDSSIVRKLLEESKNNNIYHLPDYSYEEFIEKDIIIDSSIIESDNSINEFNSLKNNDTCIYVNGFITIEERTVLNSKLYLILKSDKNNFVFKTNSMRRKELSKNMIFDDNKLSYSFVLLKNGMNVPQGIYKLGFLIRNNNEKDKIFYTNEVVVF